MPETAHHIFSNPAIQSLYEASLPLNGNEILERGRVTRHVTPDAIREFAHAVGDDNPLWLDAEYAANSTVGRLTAPPTFVSSVQYPVLHGAKIPSDLANLVNSLEVQWYDRIYQGDTITAKSIQNSVHINPDANVINTVTINSTTFFSNQHDKLVCLARASVKWKDVRAEQNLKDVKIPHYSPEKIRDLEPRILHNQRTASDHIRSDDLSIGTEIDPLVLPPLSIADIVSWESAIGLPFRAGRLKYVDAVGHPHSTVISPVSAWRFHRSEAHIDPVISPTRGMPLPFDNAVMRLSRLCVMITDWMGDAGQLVSSSIKLHYPLFYGHASIHQGTISGFRKHQDIWLVDLDLIIRDQDGTILTTGHAVVMLPDSTGQK